MEMKKEKMSESVVEMETAMVALGVVLLIAGAKHALASLVEQWRATVFLFLNLLLLAILFTSVKPSNSKNKSEIKIKQSDDHMICINKKQKNKTIKTSIKKANAPTSVSVQTEDFLCRNVVEKDDVVVDVDDDKEDLNARVEAFIVMFRQQLALDTAKARRSSTTTQESRRASFSL